MTHPHSQQFFYAVVFLALNFGTTHILSQETLMAKERLVSSFKKGDKVILYNISNNNTASPTGESKRVLFTVKKDAISPTIDSDVPRAAFFDGQKYDGRNFFRASDVAEVFADHDVCFVNVASFDPNTKSTEIMNSLKALKFSLEVESPPTFEPIDEKDYLQSFLTINIKPTAVPGGYITSIICEIHGSKESIKPKYTVEQLAKVFKMHAGFYQLRP